MGVIKGICISEKRGTAKHEIEEAILAKDWGFRETLMRDTGTDRSACYLMKKSKNFGKRVLISNLVPLGKT